MRATSRASYRPSKVDFDGETAASSRRAFLQTGVGAALGLTLPSMLLRAETAGARLAAGRGQPVGTPIRSCIFVYFYGGPSHIDTWDMKPSAPKEVRGELSPIATAAPGILVCEHLPRLARLRRSGPSFAACTTR